MHNNCFQSNDLLSTDLLQLYILFRFVVYNTITLSHYIGACTKDEEFKKGTSETSPFSLDGASAEASFEEETQFDNAQDKSKSSGNHEEPSVLSSKPYRSLPLLHWLLRRKGDLSAAQQETGADQAQGMGSFTRKIFQSVFGGGTQKTDDTGSGQKEPTESPNQKTSSKPKSKSLFSVCTSEIHVEVHCSI